jgi:gliding motility-associated-like protein
LKKKFLYYLWLCCLLLLWPGASYAQKLPPLQPEQDRCGALTLCGGHFYTPYSYQGYGRLKEQQQLNTGNVLTSICCDETHTVWFRIEIATAGNMVLTITPVNSSNDYDFTIYNLTTTTCDGPQTDEMRVRCNGNTVSGSNGQVGLNYTSTETYVPAGRIGYGFLQYLEVKAGEVYYLLIDNYTGSGDGFSIDFTGSTAGFKSDGVPVYENIVSPCNYNSKQLQIHLDKAVLCNSVAPDGSDFHLESAIYSITGASGLNCTNAGYTRDIVVTFSHPLPAGSYTMLSQQGTDGNTLISVCGEPQPVNDAIGFPVKELKVNAGEDTSICMGMSLTLQPVVTGGGILNTFSWQPAMYLNSNSDASPVTTPDSNMTYVVTVVPDGETVCAKTDTIHIRLLKGFDILTADTAVCEGQTVPLHVTGDADFHYSWTPAAAVSSNDVMNPVVTPAETTVYTLKASYAGCKDSLQSVSVTVEPVPRVDIKYGDTLCYGKELRMYAGVTPQSYHDYRYSWRPAALFNDAAASNPLFHPVPDATVSLTVTTLHGCKGTDSKKITVYPFPVVDAGPDMITAAGKPVTLKGTTDHSLATILWTPAAYLSNNRILMPVATPLKDQHYYLTVTSAGNCSAYDSVMVKVYNEINAPNAFSPNGDGIHDTWIVPYLKEYPLATIDIFNRWGQLVYHTDASHANGWNGTLNDKPLPAGAYYYIIQPRANGYGKITGMVTLIR